jgi:hypothetical protein
MTGSEIIAECEAYWRAKAGSATLATATHLPTETRLARRMAAYRMHEAGMSWRQIGLLLGVSHVAAFKAAKRWTQ